MPALTDDVTHLLAMCPDVIVVVTEELKEVTQCFSFWNPLAWRVARCGHLPVLLVFFCISLHHRPMRQMTACRLTRVVGRVYTAQPLVQLLDEIKDTTTSNRPQFRIHVDIVDIAR